jgi:hypothetical protein
LEQGTVPWQKPWCAKTQAARNLVSGKAYRGINALLLNSMGYSSPFWMTFLQARHLAQIISELSSNGTSLICTSQGIDTSDSNPAGRLQLGVLMAVAEFEREIIKERVNAGLMAARARGAKLGRPSTLDGHRQAVAALVSRGIGARRIARELGLPLSSACKLVRLIKGPGN